MIGVAALMLAACGGGSSGGGTTKDTVTVTKAGDGAGTVTSAPAGIDCGATCAADFNRGSSVTLSAAATAGSTFTGWTGGCVATTATCVVTVSADTAVTATFAAVHPTLRVFAWGGGNTDPAPGVYPHNYGDVVTLTATPAADHSFTGWSGGASGTDATVTITLTADTLVGARFWSGTPGTSTLPTPPTGPVAQPSGTPGNLQVLDWAGFDAAVSYTFDDALSSQEANYAALAATGEKFTFFVIPGMAEKFDKLATWQQMAADGNEMANHTKTHCHVTNAGVLSGCIADWAQEGEAPETTVMAEIDYTDDYIQQTLGQAGVFTMASPWGEATWDQFAGAAGYIANRDISGSRTNMLNLPSTIFGKESWGGAGYEQAVITTAIDAAVTGNLWNVFLFHAIGTPVELDPPNGSDAEGCCEVPIANIVGSIEYAQDLATPVWIGRMVDVAAYQIGQTLLSGATPVTTGGTTTWTWTLPPNFPPGQYVRVTVDGGILSQNGQALAWDAHGYYEVALDAGELTLRTPSALKIQGTTGANAAAGEHGLTVHFAIPATDLTAGNWTVSYQYYKPAATPDTQYTARQIQFGLGAAPWTSAYWNKYDGWSDTWRTVTYNLNDATAAGAKFAGATVFNIAFPYDTTANPDGTAVTWYLRNVRISDDAGHKPLDLTVTTDTDPSVASITTGTATVTIGVP